jgi:hypothetical protein
VNERRARPGRVVGIAESVAAAVRRRQRDREPRVLLVAANGAAHSIAPSASGYDELLAIADHALELAAGGETQPAATRDEDAGLEPPAGESAA